MVAEDVPVGVRVAECVPVGCLAVAGLVSRGEEVVRAVGRPVGAVRAT